MYKTINVCGRGKCCPKLTLPVIKGTKYGPKDWFYLTDDYGNECKYNIENLLHIAKTINNLQK